MRVGDLVRYDAKDGKATSLPREDEQMGIITALGKWNKEKPECHIVWFTCDNEGWWNSESLVVISELARSNR